jgi:hypothetical protein
MEQKELLNLIGKTQSTDLMNVIGNTLHANGVTSIEFYDFMKKHGHLTTLFGNNVLNAIQNNERKSNELTLKTVDSVISELTTFIKNDAV